MAREGPHYPPLLWFVEASEVRRGTRGAAFLWACMGGLAVCGVVVGWAQEPELELQFGHGAEVWSVAFSPDAKLVASAEFGDAIKLWEVATGRQLAALRGDAFPLAFSPDGRLLAYRRFAGAAIVLWELATKREVNGLVHSEDGVADPVWSVCFSPDGRLLAGGHGGGEITLWDVATGEESGRLEGHTERVVCLAFSPDSRLLVSGSNDWRANLWDVATGDELQSLEGHQSPVTAVAFADDGNLLVSASERGIVKTWVVASGEQARSWGEAAETSGHPIALSRDGRLLAARRRGLRVWDVAQEMVISELAGEESLIRTADFSPDGTLVALGARDGTVTLWNVHTGAELGLLALPYPRITMSARLSPSAQHVALGWRDGGLELWDFAARKIRELPVDETDGRVKWLSFARNGELLGARCFGGGLRLFEVTTGRELLKLDTDPQGPRYRVLSPDASLVAAVSGEETIEIRSLETGAVVREVKPGKRPAPMAFSPDCTRFLSTGWSVAQHHPALQVWDVAKGELLRERQTTDVTAPTFSPDGRLLAYGANFRSFGVQEFDTGRGGWGVSEGHAVGIVAIAFRPDGKVIASAANDKTVTLWDAETGAEVRTFGGHDNSVRSLAFTEDGKVLAGLDSQGRVVLWEPDSGKLLAQVVRVFGAGVPEGSQLALTPEGYYDGTPEAIGGCIRFRVGEQLHPAAEFEEQYHRPDLVAKALRGQAPE